jgi:hypothetical protein
LNEVKALDRFLFTGFGLAKPRLVCKRRNEQRPVEERVPVPGILGAAGRMQIPDRDEGLDKLYYIYARNSNAFIKAGCGFSGE